MEETKPGYSVGKHLGSLRRCWVFTLICGFPSYLLGFFSVFGLIAQRIQPLHVEDVAPGRRCLRPVPGPTCLPRGWGHCVFAHLWLVWDPHWVCCSGKLSLPCPLYILERDHTLRSSTPAAVILAVVCPVAEACRCSHSAGCRPQVQDTQHQIWVQDTQHQIWGSSGRRRGATCGCFHLLLAHAFYTWLVDSVQHLKFSLHE